VKFLAREKGKKKFLSTFVGVFGSDIWDPGWIKIRIRDRG
jgi:hypothetical protein